MKPTYYRCRNDECSFFTRRKMRPPYDNPNKKNMDGARWLILVAVIEGDSWAKIRCPHCDYRKNVNCDVVSEVVDLGESVFSKFKGLNKEKKLD